MALRKPFDIVGREQVHVFVVFAKCIVMSGTTIPIERVLMRVFSSAFSRLCLGSEECLGGERLGKRHRHPGEHQAGLHRRSCLPKASSPDDDSGGLAFNLLDWSSILTGR